MPVTTNYKTDLGNVFVSYSDFQNLVAQDTPIATLVLTNLSTAEESSINFYNTQKRTNNYTIDINILATLIVRSGYYVNLNTTTSSTDTTGNTIYYPGNYALNLSITGVTINSISVYNPVGQYWSLYPASSISSIGTNGSSTTISTSSFTSIIGNNFNNTNIVLANSGSSIPIYRYNSTTDNYGLFTNIYISYSNSLSNLSFSQLFIPYNNSLYYLLNSPVSISNDNSTLLYVLNYYVSQYEYDPTTQSYYYIYTFYAIPFLCSINVATQTCTLLSQGSTITLGTNTNSSSTATPTVTITINKCQVQLYNGTPFCMMSGSSGLWVNNGTSGSSFTFTQPSSISSSVNSISMSETGQYQLVASSTNYYYSNNFGTSFITSTSSNIYSNLQISALTQYAVASSGYTPYLSSDYGVTWTAIAAYSVVYTGPSTISSITISSDGQSIIINNQISSYYSSDNGTTFTETTSTTTGGNTSYIFPSEQPIAIALGLIEDGSTATGIYISQ